MPKRQLEDRLRLFHLGQWSELWASSMSNEAEAHQFSTPRRSRPPRDEEEGRSDRARSLVQMGESSAAREALEAAPVAPGTMATLGKLTDPRRRPPLLREELCQEVVNSVPARLFELHPVEFLVSMRTARRGAAAGPSGMTADHLSTILDNEAGSTLLVEAASRLVFLRRTRRDAANPTGEGGEQGDPLMPLLLSLGQHPALEAAQRRLRDNRSCSLTWTMWFSCAVLTALPRLKLLLVKSSNVMRNIDVHQGKTQVWNRGGVAPEGMKELIRCGQVRATHLCPENAKESEFWLHQSEAQNTWQISWRTSHVNRKRCSCGFPRFRTRRLAGSSS